MRLIDATLPTVDENLALDEALLNESRENVLRFWEPDRPAVVLGRSSDFDKELSPQAHQRDTSIHRRVSGGASIVTGPGCLMYALALNTADRPELGSVDRIHSSILDRMISALKVCDKSIQRAGTSDMAFVSEQDARLLKFSGNSLRLTKSRVLYHGTLLHDFDLRLIERLLSMPPREPGYRASRAHREFVGNLGSDADQLKHQIAKAWSAESMLDHTLFADAVSELVSKKYSYSVWIQARRVHAP